MTRFTGRSLGVVLTFAVGLAFSHAPATAAEIGKTLDEIKALAKKEGTVRIANSWRGPVLKALAKGAKEKYGVKFKQTRVSGISSRDVTAQLQYIPTQNGVELSWNPCRLPIRCS